MNAVTAKYQCLSGGTQSVEDYDIMKRLLTELATRNGEAKLDEVLLRR